MRLDSGRKRSSVASVGPLMLALAGGAACSGGKTAIESPADGPISDAADASGDASARDVGDAADGSDARDARADSVADLAEVGADGRGVDGPLTDATEARAEVAADVADERPSATATWTIGTFPMCTAAGAGCMDTGTVGGYQITASGVCPLASDVQLWFPGGAAPLAAGTYAVKAASGILDVIAMPAGMVGVLAERDDAANAHFRYWGRSGTVTVAAAGAARHVSFTAVALREETSSAMTTLGADVTCP